MPSFFKKSRSDPTESSNFRIRIRKFFAPRLPVDEETQSLYFGRNLKKSLPLAVRAHKCYIYTIDGREVLDASSGAAVSCIGHGDKRVQKALIKQLKTGVAYLSSAFWSHASVNELCDLLVRSTDNQLTGVSLGLTGSDSNEAMVKLARQYFLEKEGQDTRRVNIIVRTGAYHGNTLGALSLSCFPSRTESFEPLLIKDVIHKVSSCNPYHQRLDGETDPAFVQRKVKELEALFKELGPETVIGFMIEPIVGAALGCVPSVPGYLEAMREVCHKYGALFMLDEIMCGMGRSGTTHAWQMEGVQPDLQSIGKGLAGGYATLSSVLISKDIVDTFQNGTGLFKHGLTYQARPADAVAALEVQRIIQKDNLLENVREQGSYLGSELRLLLNNHPNVGDIRGVGLFWGIQFLKNKVTKEPYLEEDQIALRIHELAFSSPYNLCVYPCMGNNDGTYGDRIIIAPPFIIARKEVKQLVDTLHKVVMEFFTSI